MSVTVRSISFLQLPEELSELAGLLLRCVNDGNCLGLPVSMTVADAEAHWLSLRQDLRQERPVEEPLEGAELLKEQSLPIPKENADPKIIIQTKSP